MFLSPWQGLRHRSHVQWEPPPPPEPVACLAFLCSARPGPSPARQGSLCHSPDPGCLPTGALCPRALPYMALGALLLGTM